MTNDKAQMTNEISITNGKGSKQSFDLDERTIALSKRCLELCKSMKTDMVNSELIRQLVRSASSVGANYREAHESISKKDFHHRISICRREAKETWYWLELLLYSNSQLSEKIEPLLDESRQLTKIFATINAKNR